ncbi:MAG TPA: DUF1501 domain-containing protein [Fimbriimonas sp.]|nr:DUF1501 domain-containing protein [Fimbriimonas sp.]
MSDNEELRNLTRRTLFKKAGYGLGNVALASLMADPVFAALASDQGGFANGRKKKAKSIIYLFMAGAPSQLDLFDAKPVLNKFDGDYCPEEYLKGERFPFIRNKPKLLGSPWKFSAHGQSGQLISELLPHLGKVADDISVIRTMQTEQFNHAPAQLFMNTGFQIPGRPSLGSWLTYGLGSANSDLPGFVVLLSGLSNPDGGKSCYGSGFLPSKYQGVEFRSQGEPVLFVDNPDGVTSDVRKDTVDAINALNAQAHKDSLDPEVEARISQYELAYRMQTSVPELMDISGESEATKEMYGVEPGKRSFGNNCLLARRLVERGVRCVQLYHRGWDHHGESEGSDIKHGLPVLCQQVDKAAAALIADLKQRGMLEDTIVVWGGEFGRTPINESRGGVPYPGRDHHPKAYSMWVAGGGFKAGVSYGQTDEIGFNAAVDPVQVHDLNATLLHLMGIDHTKLTYKFQGRNFRLTDVFGNVLDRLIH